MKSAEPGRTGERRLPVYDGQLSAFHRAFAAELQEILDRLPLQPGMRVLDLACGDGFYTRRIAERLGAGGASPVSTSTWHTSPRPRWRPAR